MSHDHLLVDVDTPGPDLLCQLRAEVASLEPGPVKAEDEALLHRVTRKLARLADEQGRALAWYEHECRRIARERAGVLYLYRSHAEATVARLLAGKKARSLRTPWGTAGFRLQPARLVVEDEATVVQAWEKLALPREAVTVKTVTAVSRSELQRLYATTGEIPPGCTVRPERDEFYIG